LIKKLHKSLLDSSSRAAKIIIVTAAAEGSLSLPLARCDLKIMLDSNATLTPPLSHGIKEIVNKQRLLAFILIFQSRFHGRKLLSGTSQYTYSLSFQG